jgi:hypothetical protein
MPRLLLLKACLCSWKAYVRSDGKLQCLVLWSQVYLRCRGLASQLTELLSEDLLVFNTDILIPEEDNPTLGDFFGMISTKQT